MKEILALCLTVLLAWAISTAHEIYNNTQLKPDIAIVLSGDYRRIHFAIQLAKENRKLPIWISGTRTDLLNLKEIILKANISKDRFTVKLCATDTVTNFTCIVDPLSELGVKHILLITSDYHMGRALTVGRIVLGSRQIAITADIVDSGSNRQESMWRAVRDIIRAIVWVFTGGIGMWKAI